MVKTPTTEKYIENRDYELIPGEQNFWKVRILTGDFIETVFQYNTVSFNERDMTVSFTYHVWYSPDDDFDQDDAEFQKVASGILHSIMLRLLDEDE